MDTTVVQLPSGASLEIEISRSPPELEGIQQASAAEKAALLWAEVSGKVADLSGQIISALRNSTATCKEVSVEFGISVGGKTGVILVEGNVNANLKVTLKW